jgi:hypothetical protein
VVVGDLEVVGVDELVLLMVAEPDSVLDTVLDLLTVPEVVKVDDPDDV